MSIDSETFKKIADNAELAEKLEKLWNENASPSQYSEALQAAGIEADDDQVEAFLAELQERRAATIALDEVDDEQLKKIAGGDQGPDGRWSGCDDAFMCYQNVFEQCDSDLYVPCSGYSVSGLL